MAFSLSLLDDVGKREKCQDQKRGWGRVTLRAGKMRYLYPPVTKLPCIALR